MKLLNKILFGVSLVIFVSCGGKEKDAEALLTAGLDPLPAGLTGSYGRQLKDVVMSDGWKVKYFTKNNKDLYVGCFKDTAGALYNYTDGVKSADSMPHFAADSPDAIYFFVGNPDSARRILAFSKISPDRFRDCRNVVKYDFSLGLILYVSRASASDPDRKFELMLMDIPKLRRHRIPYSGFCTAPLLSECIDSVNFNHEKVTLVTRLGDAPEPAKYITETRIIKR